MKLRWVAALLTASGLALAALVLADQIKLMPSLARLFSAVASERGAQIETAIRYGPLERNVLDVYRPANGARPKAAVLFIYGGGWRSGSRAYYGFVGAALAKRGYAAVIPDYRLFPEASFPAFEEDAAAAYRWTATELAKDGMPIFVAGHSAGAHIGALLVYDERYLADTGANLPKPAGFIGLAGPYSFDPRTDPTTADIFRNDTPGTARPVEAVKRGAPPSWLVHGVVDKTVNIRNTREFAQALSAQGVTVDTVELAVSDHLGPLLALSWPFRWRAPVLRGMTKFMDDTVSRAAAVQR